MLRKIGYISGFIFLLLASAYTGVWFYYANTVKKDVTGFIEDLREDGSHVLVKDLSMGGYPFSMKVNFEGRIASNGYVAEVPELIIDSFFIPGKDIVITFPQGLEVTEPYDPVLWSLDYLTLSGIVPEYLPESLTQEDMHVWYQNNGSIVLESLELKKETLRVQGNGLMAVDQNLQPKGRFQAVVKGHMDFLQWLQLGGFIKTKEALISATVLTGLTRTNENGESFMPVDLILENRKLYAGPLQVMTFPEIVWPWKDLNTTPLDQLQ